MASSEEPASLFCSIGSPTTSLSDEDIKSQLHKFLAALGDRDDVLILPPDFTRFHSQAGKITRFICEHYNFVKEPKNGDDGDENGKEPEAKRAKGDGGIENIANSRSSSSPSISILPALGTHFPMTEKQIDTMFGTELAQKTPSPFRVHDWRKDVVTIGHAPAEMVSKATNGMVNRPWPAQLNKHVWEKRNSTTTTPDNQKPLILSVGQVVPHEVMGMANFNKNLFVGVGGVEAINLSHFIGAVHGMERMMGRASNPLRSILNYSSEKFLQKELDLWYILTVMGTDEKTGNLEMRGLYIGKDISCYNIACDLSLKTNFTMLDRAPKKMVVHLDEDEFHSTWLGNKAIYRTRMAIADGGELIILAPGVKQFGEDGEIDKLIRAHGYVGTPAVLKAMEEHKHLQENLSAVAHLIHGSSEGRFSVTYCPGHLTKKEVEGVGFRYRDLEEAQKMYDVKTLKDGWNTETNKPGAEEEFYYISNPALGLWAFQSRFDDNEGDDAASFAVNDKASEVTTSDKQEPSGDSGGVGGWAKPPKSD